MTRKQKTKFYKKIKDAVKRTLTGTLAIYMLITSTILFIPSYSYALTGGPSQPEVQSFEPIGTSDMVNLFSGDFTYNIPLLDVEGYPINLAYNGGISMDQEASWVGLGWNINVGTINRGLRGIPDDFNGDLIKMETNMKPNRTVTAGSGISGELFGWEALGFSADLGISYNNYNGIGLSFGAGLNVSAFGGALNSGLGLSSSSDNGLSISPNVSLSSNLSSNSIRSESLSLGIGTSFNSRGGLKQLSINASKNRSMKRSAGKTKKDKQLYSSISSSMGTGSSYSLGQQTYIPSGGIDMNSFAIAGRFKLGLEAFGFDGGLSFDASYSSQWIANSSKSNNSPAYGYFNTQNGQGGKNSLLDFNREKDGVVSNSTPALPITNYTYDVYSVSGQGVGGSYRGFRSEIGYVHDPKGSSTSTSADLGAEGSFGQLIHAGANVGAVVNNSSSGEWKNFNKAKKELQYSTSKPYPDFEPYYLREANEMSVNSDESYFDEVGGDQAAAFSLRKGVPFVTGLKDELRLEDGTTKDFTNNTRKKRDKRNSIITTKTVGQLNEGLGSNGTIPFPANSHALNNDDISHHIGEITSLGMDGMRYVYGLPAFNTKQQEVTFAIGTTTGLDNFPFSPDCQTGLVEYTPHVDNTLDNQWGRDNYFQNKETPAYAHSYLLTSVVSPDYVDVDNNGPSPIDLGTYTKFNYQKIQDYCWRTPTELNKASYNAGLNTDVNDDKANYIYGEKELWYLSSIETKNFIAIFDTEDRLDGKGVIDENGGLSNKSMQKLKTITLYSKPDYDANGVDATPLKTVNFEYEYELCPGITNHVNYNSNIPAHQNPGKLTLKKVFFTYRDSKKGKLSPYEFVYGKLDQSTGNPIMDLNTGKSINNYAYNMRGYDRWGNYKENEGTSACNVNSPLSSSDYPYVQQSDKTKQDLYASAWSLTRINLPSGGVIKVDLESDDYSFVQNREAMQMFKIISVGNASNAYVSSTSPYNTLPVTEDDNSGNLNRRIFFELDPSNTTDIDPYIKNIEYVYFRCLMQFADDDKSFDFVPGYAEIDNAGITNASGVGPVGYIDFKPVSIKDPNDTPTHSPIAVAASQYGRMHLPNQIWNSPQFDDTDQFGAQLLEEVVQTFYTNFKDGFQNPNKAIFKKGKAINLVVNKSWLRLNTVNSAKLGGGVRVKSIKMNDSWNQMTDITNADFDYGQEYDYTETDIINGNTVIKSSGVASYEPQLGGDENPFRQPFFYGKENLMAPDDRFYQEEPFGESFFPSASVGYSKVIVKNLQRNNVTRHATGKVVHDFYTCKEYPTITKMTTMNHKRDKVSPFSILSILNFDSKDYFTASQGFVVELNDMNGKPKAQSVFQENKAEPITQVEYFYQSNNYSVVKNGIKSSYPIMDPATKKLENEVNVVFKNGTVSKRNIGVVFDAVADFRQSKNTTISPSANGNLDTFIIPFLPPFIVPVITVWPSYQQQRTRFRSAGFTKVIQRFGVLEKTVAKDLGSVVETKNLAYDAETGNVLLTETTTNFNDKIYTLNYPAYWYYDRMGPAYQNIGFETAAFLINGVFSDNSEYFTEGDEVILYSPNGSSQKAWVTSKTANSVGVQLFHGNVPNDGIYSIEVVRSGRRNQQMQNMASITTLSNPLNTFKDNLYENVIQASAIEFSENWRTYCECFEDENGNNISTNPFVLGTKGNFRPIISYLPLSDRTQSNDNGSTNIRQDGMFEKYRPYYKLNNGRWEVDRQDWTYTASVTEFNPYGQELENQDALGRYSAATFGFNQTLAKSVAANARFRDIGFTSFEDDDFSECADNHFKFDQNNLSRDADNSHTGVYSIKVSPGNDANLTREIAWCDPETCTLNIEETSANNSITLTPVNGNPDYIIDWELVSGDMPTFNIDPVNKALTIRKNLNFILIAKWTDSEGCSVTYKVEKENTHGANTIEVIKIN